MKKAAMFGLDARIALAIFGALSVISGAALYSAIESSKAVAMSNQLSEIAKAYESYYLDTGTEMPHRASNNYDYYVNGLYEDNNVRGWKGPYLDVIPASTYTFDYQYSYGKGRTYIQYCNNTFGGQFSKTNCTRCTTGPCSVYIKVTSSLPNIQTVAKNLDQLIDNSDGLDKGKFRAQYCDATVSDNMRLYYYVKTIN